jgi:hypothetical protein
MGYEQRKEFGRGTGRMMLEAMILVAGEGFEPSTFGL